MRIVQVRATFHQESCSWMFILRLCVKFGLEYSTPPSEDDTDDSGIELETVFGWEVWFLKIWAGWEYAGLGASGVGCPWAASASCLRRFKTVGRNLAEIESSPASC